MPRNNIYLELVGRLECRLSGMEENSLLPPEQKLAEEFKVSKPTVRRALQALVEAGQIRKINGVGIVVTRCPRSISRELIFVCHDIVFFAEALKSFGIKAGEHNYFISIVPLSGDALNQERIVTSALERRPAGMVIYADPRNNHLAAFQRLVEEKIPVLYVIRLPHDLSGNLLEFGNADGMTEIVETFYRDGCRRIALYGDELVNPVAAVERREGFLTGLKKCRLKPREELQCIPGTTAEERELFLQRFETADERPDAVCCLNDFCAGKLIKTLLRRGVDLSSIRFSGFDHSPLSEFIPQPLLTVEPPMEQFGTVAAEMVIRQVENPQFGFQRRKLRGIVITTK